MSGAGIWAAKLANMHEKLSDDLDGFGGILRCETCRRTAPLDHDARTSYLRSGWPKCHGHTMRWWTQRQIDAGEMPD